MYYFHEVGLHIISNGMILQAIFVIYCWFLASLKCLDMDGVPSGSEGRSVPNGDKCKIKAALRLYNAHIEESES